MTRPRIYHPRIMRAGDLCHLEEDRFHYLKTVLRLDAGAAVVLFDGCGGEYDGVIRRLAEHDLSVEITGRRDEPMEEGSRITLCQSIPKAGKMAFIIQKATELGADRIIPFFSKRSVPRLQGEKAKEKVTRWRKIAVEAARQCGRARIPEITEIVGFRDMLNSGQEGETRIIFWEEETGKGLRQFFSERQHREGGTFFLVVGPEGGFAGEEIDSARAQGFTSLSLGRRVLKVETAAVAVLSIVQYELGAVGGARGIL